MSAQYDQAMAVLDEILDGIDLDTPTPVVKEFVQAKATIVAAEAGEFSAVISTVKPDRENDVVLPSAVVDALQAWGDKPVPLAWQHRADDPDEIVGTSTPTASKPSTVRFTPTAGLTAASTAGNRSGASSRAASSDSPTAT